MSKSTAPILDIGTAVKEVLAEQRAQPPTLTPLELAAYRGFQARSEALQRANLELDAESTAIVAEIERRLGLASGAIGRDLLPTIDGRLVPMPQQAG